MRRLYIINFIYNLFLLYNLLFIKNNKNLYMEMRDLLKKMRKSTTDNIIESDRDKGSARNLLNSIRNYNKIEIKEEPVEKTLANDQEREEEKMRGYFQDLEVMIDFIELEIFEKGIFWGGTIDGVVQFVYKVTPDEKSSGFEIYYLEDFDKNNPDNEEISNRIERYYEEFFKFWRDNFLQK